jgi:hypothetical protein
LRHSTAQPYVFRDGPAAPVRPVNTLNRLGSPSKLGLLSAQSGVPRVIASLNP